MAAPPQLVINLHFIAFLQEIRLYFSMQTDFSVVFSSFYGISVVFLFNFEFILFLLAFSALPCYNQAIIFSGQSNMVRSTLPEAFVTVKEPHSGESRF